MDRLLPISMFDEKSGSSKPVIQINISGIGDSSSPDKIMDIVDLTSNIEDAEYEDL
jgi:hypothetical protein